MNSDIFALAESVLAKYSLVTAFAVVALVVWFSYWASAKFTKGHLHGSAIAIFIALVAAGMCGMMTKGKQGVADIAWLSGVGLLGGAMLRDFAIVATAFGVKLEQFTRTGFSGVLSLFLGLFVSFFVGASAAWAFGYRDAVSLTTIGGGAGTFIIGPVTGTALGASSEVIALSVAAGLVKAIIVMCATPFVAPLIGLDNPRTALIFGGLMGTTSGVAAGLAATDEKLVPYGAMTATFYTGLGCLVGPSVVFVVIRALLG